LLTEKIVVAPSLAVGHQIADAVALGGTPWVNLRFETLRTLADGVASFEMAARGVQVLSRAQALAFVGRACDRALDSNSYFAQLSDRPGLHRAIQRTLDDLRYAAVDLSVIPASAFEEQRKAADLAGILSAYEEELTKANAVDRYTVTAHAVSMLEKGAKRPGAAGAIWMALDDLEMTAMEERLLRLIAGECRVIPPPSSFAEQQPGIESNDAGRRGEVRAGRSIDFRRATGEENEIRAVFRAILAARTSFDDAEIVYSSRDPYLATAFELASEYSVPCTFAEGISAPFTRPGQACLGFLRWIGEGWHAGVLQKIARSGALQIWKADESKISPTGFARVLRRASIGWGRDRYLERIDGFIAEQEIALATNEHEGRQHAIERAISEARAARGIVVELLEMTTPVADGDELGLGTVARAAAAFVQRFATVANDTDAMAKQAILGMLHELSEIAADPDAFPAKRADSVSRLIDAVKEVHVGASNPRPGFLHVAPIRAAGWNQRSRMFVVGLDDQKHPGKGIQDPIMLDGERGAVNELIDPRSLPLLGDAPARTTEQFRRLMARTQQRTLTLSFSSIGIRDRRQRFPAAVLLEMYRNVKRSDATYAEVEQLLVNDTFVDPQPITGGDWWMMRRFAGEANGVATAIRSAYPWLASGEEALRARASDAITKYDGKIIESAEVLDPRLNGRVYSASGLESIARCPYQYFLKSVMHIDPVEELEFDPDSWLEAYQFGLMFHEVLQHAMDQLSAEGLKPSLAFLPQMTTIAQEALGRWRRTVPPPSESTFEARRSELFESCEIFLRIEEDTCRTVTPKFFEVSFGFGESSDASLAMPDPLVLSVGGGKSIRVRGRIDRVDHDEEKNEWHVWDYKSGSTYEYDGGGNLQSGTKLQHALYARAVEAMLARKKLSGKVTKSGYYFPTAKGRGARIDRVCSDAELKSVLNQLCDVVGSGYFLHADEERCKFCDYGEICGGKSVVATQAYSKMAANPDHPAVEAWNALRNVR